MHKPTTIGKLLRGRFFLLFCSVLSLVAAFFISGKENADFGSTATKFENILDKKEDHAKRELLDLSAKVQKATYKKLFNDKPGYYESLFDNEGLVFLIFENDTLRFWTDNTVAIDNHLSQNNFSEKIVKLPNGWFEVERFSTGKKQLFALVLLKRDYSYQNKYLTNEFQSEFDISSDVNIQVDAEKIGKKSKSDQVPLSRDVYEKEGGYLCTLVFPFASSGSTFVLYLAILLNILGLFFALNFLQVESVALSAKIGNGWSLIFFAFTVAVFRFLIIELDFPKVFYETKLFSPELFGDASSVWLGSLGDLLINALLLFYLVYYCCKHIKEEYYDSYLQEKDKKNILQWMFILGIIVFLFFCSRVINYLFSGIINNSNIPFTLNDIFSQNIYTYLSLSIVGLFFISYFLLLDKAASVLYRLNFERKYLIAIVSSAIFVFVILSRLSGISDLNMVLWPVAFFLLIMWVKYQKNGYPFSYIVVLLFIISFFSAHVVLKFAEAKERDSRKVFAQKLSAEQDPLAEHLFSKIETPMSTDTSLINLLFHPHKKKYPIRPFAKTNVFTKALLEKYFSGYWEKYDIRVSVYDTTCFPLVQGSSPDRDNLAYFEDAIATHAIPTESPNFFYLTKSSGHISYLARIPFVLTKDVFSRIGDLFIEFDSRVISDEIGFPELLLDRKLSFLSSVLGGDYSYAKYKNGKLVTYHGKFPYGLTADNFPLDSTAVKEYPKSSFRESDNYEHLFYMPSQDSIVIISKKSEGTIKMLTTFSYLFAFFSMLLLFLVLLRELIYEKRFRIASFRSRIQYILVLIVLVSLLFFGGGTIYYIVQDYQAKNLETIREKTSSALIEIEGKLGSNDELLASQKDYATYLLKKYSAVFFTDINLYSKDGDLLASSVSKIFDEGILSRKMCSEAYHEMALHQKLEFINTEHIGKLNYLSAYFPLKNDKGEVLAFLNLPYFARQSELEKEISAILAALINIYVLLFVISVMVAIILSEYITKPLKLIQEKLSKVKLGKESEPIEWKSQDEIGSLVNEYNRMIDALQMSAELLAKSERETAWREMAKQVAHEIKNPLTPMKLSIQHLQRTWKNKDDDMDKKIERITATIIEQIETLSVIASEFSNFAKMPVTVNEKINMRNVLENAISLFKDSSDTEIDFSSEVEEANIYADKEQLLRVFNNLLKNAIQAIPENIQGKIQVTIGRTEGMFLVKIKDNGTGINEEQISKIFTPNFTTKSGGMGLGLAMVRSIIETFSGKIWFETTKGIGTTFFISIPEHREVNS